MIMTKKNSINMHQLIDLLEYVEKLIKGSEWMPGPTAYGAVIRTWVWK